MMKKNLTITALLCIVINHAFSQAPGCANIIAPADFTLPCTTPCTTLTSVPFHVGQTTTYTVGAIPYAPVLAYTAPGTAVSVGTDDVWSPVINLPFPFCYFGTTYNSCKVGSNGSIMFGPAGGGGFNEWEILAGEVCPSAALWAPAAEIGHLFGVYHDIDPTVSGTVRWSLVGTAPCRMLVVNFNNMGHYSCTSLRSTFQMVLYETTNVIEVYVQNKATCASWNGGKAIIGIQNTGGTAGIAAPGRNSNSANWTITAATSEAWRFTPNGAPIYTTAWYQGGTLLATGNTVNVCPTGTTTYTARVTYTRCDGVVINDQDDVTITLATLPAPTVSTTAETCNNYNNGQVVIDNAAGPGPFTVNISGPTTGSVVEPNTAAGNATFTNLPDGNYNYTVTSAAGCTFSGTFTITAGPPCCSVTANGTNITCFGGNGTATANPVGLAGFGYSWSSTPVQTTQTATNLPAGTYTVTMTDNSGCTATANVTITQPTQINATTTLVHPLCNGGTNGSITVNASGGTGALQYSLNGGPFQTSNVFNTLGSGTYTIVVRDANGCTRTFTATLNNPPTLTVTVTSTVNATCGSSNGSITVTGSGGTGLIQYSIGGPFNASGNFNSLAPGPYTITARDANNCTVTTTATVGTSAGPVASINSQTNLSCFGGANGAVLIGASGGTAPIQYSIDLAGPTPATPFQLSNSFTGLAPGTYTATIRDANNCTGTVTFTITTPTALTYTSLATPASCNGVCDGQIAITASGGTPPYQYSGNSGATFVPASPLTGLCAGNINVVVKDANGCLSNSVVPITQPGPITATYTLTNPICPDVCNGQIQVNPPSGGTLPYQYSLNGGGLQPSGLFTGVCNGNNTVVVQDANGCQLTSNQVLTDPPAFTITEIANVESNCGADNGSFEVVASGGFAPYTYNNITLGISQIGNGAFGPLFAGGYNVEVTDNNGCVQNLFVGVNDVEMDGVLDGVVDATCYGSCDGEVFTHAVNGAPPIQFDLDLAGAFELDGDFTGLCGGSHIVLIIDNGACVFTVPFNVNEPDEIIFTSAVTNVACNGGATGSITFNLPTGGNGVYQYSINGGAYQASPTFTGLAAGTYTLSVMDGNGCLGSGSATINEANPINLAATVIDLTCNGNNSGFIQAVASGGTGAFQFSKDGGTTYGASPVFNSLSAATYNIAARDAAGCVEIIAVTVNQPAPLVAPLSMTPATCNGECDGTITVTASGGTSPYQFSSDNGTTYQVSNILGGLCAGTYQVTVKDDNDCLIGSSQIITEPTVVTYTTTVTDATCGNANGTITFNAPSGGTPGYEYSIDGGTTFVTTPNFTGLAPNTYNLVVKDNNDCEFDATAVILDLASPVITSGFATDVTCNGACDGTFATSATGGTGTLMYDIGGAAQAGTSFTGICAGNYVLTVTDANSCTDVLNFTITEPAALTLTSVPTHLSCFNDQTGEIQITAGGGTLPYLYSYDGGATFSSLDHQVNLSAGTYNLIVKDDHDCQITGTETLTEPADLVIDSQTDNDASCFGICDGDATVNISGGTAPGGYTYTWSGSVAGAASNTATNLCAGTYTVDIVDDNGCTINTSFNIIEPPQVIISGFSATDVLCNGNCDGTITITAPLAVDYSIDNGATFSGSNAFNSLCPGTYDIVVRDGNGCPATTSAVINEPTPVVLADITDLTICYDGYGTLEAYASGGTPPYTYTWNTGAITQFYTVNTHVPMTYTCTVTDLNGCASNSESANVTVLPKLVPSVTPASQTICPGDTVVFTASAVDGVPGYDFYWVNAAHDTIGIGETLTYIPPTTGTITLLASDQCPSYDSVMVNVYNYQVPQPVMPTPQWGCSPLLTTLTNSTDSTVAVTWDFGDGSPTDTSNTTINHTYIVPGCYDVTMTVTSNHGCVGDSTFNDIVCVYPDPVVDFTYNPSNPTTLLPNVNFVNLTPDGALFDWDFAGADSSSVEHPSFSFNELGGGEHLVCLEVVSTLGCKGDTCKLVMILDETLIYVPNAFTPDADGMNDIFLPSVAGVRPEGYEFYIFDRWGELVFQTTDKLQGWDGTFKSTPAKEDVYVWKMKAKMVTSEDVKEYYGHITLLR